MHREVFPKWSRPPAKPGLREGLVDIWRIDLSIRSGGLPTPGKASSQGDSGPGPGSAPAGQRAAAHRLMREILGRYIDCPTRELQIKKQAGGKPYLHAPERPLEFNLSHSRDIALLAVSTLVSVGIDVEAYREIDDPLRLARRVMSAEEYAEIESLPDEARLDRFLNLWTRMEARQKAIGRGIFAQPADPGVLTSFSFRPGPGLYAGLSISPAITNPELRFLDLRLS